MEKDLQQQPSNCVKVVLYGPESTGKTTLSKQLARHFSATWVPEYAREYLQNKWNIKRETCRLEDILPIAQGQMKLENELAKIEDTLLICDTDLLETKVYSETFYSGVCHPTLKKYALSNTYNLYFLTYIDTPWQPDDLRDRPAQRIEMFEAFQDELIKHNKPYVLIQGSRAERLKTAVKHINQLLKKNK